MSYQTTIGNKLAQEVEQFPKQGRNRLAKIVLADSFMGIISQKDADALCQDLDQSIESVLLALVAVARAYAYPPISNYHVGAVVQGESGALYFGANLEFPGLALNATVHAEQAAVLYAWLQGERGLRVLAVNGSPCGHCRQFLTEINNPALIVKTPEIDARPLIELLPGAFGPSALGNSSGLMEPANHGLIIDNELESQQLDDMSLIETALAMANRSYAPYSQGWASVAVKTTDGEIFAAPYAENAAFNPSLSPLQGVLVAMRLQQKSWAQIQQAVLVETKATNASQAPATQALFKTIGDTQCRVVLV